MEWLKQAWNWVKGALGFPVNAPELVPDLSLIRDYTRELNREAPFSSPYLTHYHKDDKHLYYIAAHHGVKGENPTFDTIDQAIAHYKPQMIIIEGVNRQDTTDRHSFEEYVKQQAADNFAHVGEPIYAAHLAMQKDISFMGGEPTDKKIIEKLQAKNYSEKDVMAFYILRNIPHMRKRDGLTGENFDAKIQDYIDHQKYYVENHIPAQARITVSEFKAWYEAHNDQPGRGVLDITTENVAPVRGAHASYFEKMSADTGEVRERHLDTEIGKAFANHDRVLVIYGSGHLVQSRRVFEQMFEDKGENITLMKQPIAYRDDWSKMARNAPGHQAVMAKGSVA